MRLDEEAETLGVIAQADLVREEGDDYPAGEKVLEEISEPVGLPR